MKRPSKTVAHPENDIPGPSPDPATNLVMTDIALRAGSYLIRSLAEKRILGRRYGKADARQIVANRSVKQTVATLIVSRIATRSVPGAILVGGGLMAKTLFDHSKKRRNARRKGDRALLDQANGD